MWLRMEKHFQQLDPSFSVRLPQSAFRRPHDVKLSLENNQVRGGEHSMYIVDLRMTGYMGKRLNILAEVFLMTVTHLLFLGFPG